MKYELKVGEATPAEGRYLYVDIEFENGEYCDIYTDSRYTPWGLWVVGFQTDDKIKQFALTKSNTDFLLQNKESLKKECEALILKHSL